MSRLACGPFDMIIGISTMTELEHGRQRSARKRLGSAAQPIHSQQARLLRPAPSQILLPDDDGRLPGMRGRAEEAGCSFTLQSVPGGGTRLRVILPAQED